MFTNCSITSHGNTTKVSISIEQLHEECFQVLLLLYGGAFATGLIFALCGFLCCYYRKRIRRHKKFDLNYINPWERRSRRGREKVQLLWSRRLSFTDTTDDDFCLKWSVSRPRDTKDQTKHSQNNLKRRMNPSAFPSGIEATALVLSSESQDRVSLSEKGSQSENDFKNIGSDEESFSAKEILPNILNINEPASKNDYNSYQSSDCVQSTTKILKDEFKLNNKLSTPTRGRKVKNVPPVKFKESEDSINVKRSKSSAEKPENNDTRVQSPLVPRHPKGARERSENTKTSVQSATILKRTKRARNEQKAQNKDLALFENVNQRPKCSPSIERIKSHFERPLNQMSGNLDQGSETPWPAIKGFLTPSEKNPPELHTGSLNRNHSLVEFLPNTLDSQTRVRIDGKIYKTKSCE